MQSDERSFGFAHIYVILQWHGLWKEEAAEDAERHSTTGSTRLRLRTWSLGFNWPFRMRRERRRPWEEAKRHRPHPHLTSSLWLDCQPEERPTSQRNCQDISIGLESTQRWGFIWLKHDWNLIASVKKKVWTFKQFTCFILKFLSW